MLYFDVINPYITYMIVVLLFVFSVRVIFTKIDFISKHKNIIINVAMIMLIWTQIARYIGIFFQEDVEWTIWIFHFRIIAFSLQSHLPFYICRLSVLVLLYYTITKDKRVESFLFYWGATGLAGVIYPNGPIMNIVNLTETFFIDHFLLAITPFFLLVYQGYRPSKKDLLIITGLMLSILLSFIPINNVLTTIVNSETQVDYFYVSNQSIVREFFGEVPKMVFILIHTFAAYLFFTVYYWFFKGKEYYN